MMLGIVRATAKVRDSIVSRVSRCRQAAVSELPPLTQRPPQQRPANVKEGRIWWSVSTKKGEAPTELHMDLDDL